MKNTKEKILDTAQEIIQQVGLNAMSYKHISDVVGIKKASIHHYFPKKEDLVNELLEKCHVKYGANYESIVDGQGDAPYKLRKVSDVFLNGLEKKELCMVGTMSSDINTLKEPSCKMLANTIQSTINTYTKIFIQGRKEDSLRFEGSEEDAAFTFFSFLLGAQIAARANGGMEKFKAAKEVFIKSFEL